MVLLIFSGTEDCLQPLRDARDLMESLAAEELRVFTSGQRSRYTVRGPMLARMELVRQLYIAGMHQIPLNLSKWGGRDWFTLNIWDFACYIYR